MALRLLVLLSLATIGCDDDVAPAAVDLTLGADRACFLGAIVTSTGGGLDPRADAGTPTGLVGAAGLPVCWGGGNPEVAPLPGARAFVALALGATSCGLDALGGVYCWGAGARGQLGDGTTAERSEPAVVPGLVAQAVDVSRFAPASAGFACALTTAGPQCWGANDRGQLGDGATLDRALPAPVVGRVAFTAIALGRAHACALDADGVVHCWGSNDQGQLGDGSLVDRLVPTPVPGLSGVAELALGADHSCARRADGTVACWGASELGQVGTLIGPVPAPRDLGLEGITQLAAGASHSCALGADTQPRCWGSNMSLQTGSGVVGPQVRPSTVAVAAKRVAAGLANTCVLNRAGSVFCWGAAGTGVLGSSGGDDTVFPSRVPGTP